MARGRGVYIRELAGEVRRGIPLCMGIFVRVTGAGAPARRRDLNPPPPRTDLPLKVASDKRPVRLTEKRTSSSGSGAQAIKRCQQQ